MAGTYQVDFHFYSDVVGCYSEAVRSDENDSRLAPYISIAVQVLSEHDVAVEDCQHLALVVKAALDSRVHFFSAALHEPNQEELDQFFADFIVRCVIPHGTRCE